jgi:hypothetical protein
MDIHDVFPSSTSQLADRDPLAVFHELAAVMGRRHDPCVL